MSDQKEKEIYVPHTAVEVLEMLEEEYPDTIQREPLESMWDYGHETGIQVVIDFLRSRLNAEFINEEDENVFDGRNSKD